MEQEKNKAIFEKYNPVTDIRRCRNGYTYIRDMMDLYAGAMVNLYGAISREDFVKIFNEQNDQNMTVDDIYVFLLPRIHKQKYYCFYKQYIVHYIFMNAFDTVETLLDFQSGKPRYIPNQEELLNYLDEEYTDNDDLYELLSFLFDVAGVRMEVLTFYERLKQYILFSRDADDLVDIFDLSDVKLSFEDLNKLLDMVNDAKGNVRVWENSGHSPIEVIEMMKSGDKQEKVRTQPVSIGRNDPCFCESGKKFKNCCMVFTDSTDAYLTKDEAESFYDIWNRLLDYVNAKKKVVPDKLPRNDSSVVHYEQALKVRNALWAAPEIIDEYLEKVPMPEHEYDVVKQWREKRLSGTFLVQKYTVDYALLYCISESGLSYKPYAVKGITQSIADVLRKRPPVLLEAVLVPFSGKIVYDTFFQMYSVKYGEKVYAMMQEVDEELEKHEVIERL